MAEQKNGQNVDVNQLLNVEKIRFRLPNMT